MAADIPIAGKSSGSHVFEHGLNEPAPRRVRVRPGLAFLVAAATLLVGVTAAFGVASLFEAARLTWLAKSGTTVSGVVTALYYGDHRELAYDVARVEQISAFEYTFTAANGSVETGVAPVELSRSMLDQHPLVDSQLPGSPKPAPPLPPRLRYVPGGHLAVRYAIAGSRIFSRPWDRPPKGHLTFLTVSGLVLTAIAASMWLRTYRIVHNSFTMVRYGRISTGVIREKIARTEDTVRYFIRFAEQGPTAAKLDGANTVEWTRPCSAQQFLGFAQGQQVTLICPPGKPDETTLYKLLPFGS